MFSRHDSTSIDFSSGNGQNPSGVVVMKLSRKVNDSSLSNSAIQGKTLSKRFAEINKISERLESEKEQELFQQQQRDLKVKRGTATKQSPNISHLPPKKSSQLQLQQNNVHHYQIFSKTPTANSNSSVRPKFKSASQISSRTAIISRLGPGHPGSKVTHRSLILNRLGQPPTFPKKVIRSTLSEKAKGKLTAFPKPKGLNKSSLDAELDEYMFKDEQVGKSKLDAELE
ncbi:hypothetical protein HK096_001026, partial [Nowakowskiella sp. JEL0078]